MQKLTPKDFINHSGGAEGSDKAWDRLGRKYGFINHLHWRPEDLDELVKDDYQQMIKDVRSAAGSLGRPHIFTGIELVYRNWLQVYHSNANIYAIAPIIFPGKRGPRGFMNTTKKPIVDGGTGWAVEMAIQKQGQVYVFDTMRDDWYMWDYYQTTFVRTGYIPVLTYLYAGIGTRNIGIAGLEAIELVYKTTLQSLQKSTDGKDTSC